MMDLRSDVSLSVRFDTVEGPERERELGALLDRSFPVPKSASFFDDFPVWKEEHGMQIRRFGAFAGGSLVASACARVARLKSTDLAGAGDTVGHHRVAGLIGAVATDSEWRGQGLASRLVAQARDWLFAQSADGVYLWGSDHDFYRRMGFELMGAQVRVPLSLLANDPPFARAPAGFVPGEGWTPVLFPLLRERRGGLALSESDEAWVRAHRNVRWYWIAHSSAPEKPLAYAGVGKGVDLPGMIHEWGGEEMALLYLIQHLAMRSLAQEWLASPSHLSHLGIDSTGLPTEYLCMGNTKGPVPADLWFWGLDGA